MRNIGVNKGTMNNKGSACDSYSSERKKHWNSLAERYATVTGARKQYHVRIAAIYGNLIPEGAKVLELGCGCGDLLASLKPSLGVGVDFSLEMIKRAQERYPALTFIEAD